MSRLRRLIGRAIDRQLAPIYSELAGIRGNLDLRLAALHSELKGLRKALETVDAGLDAIQGSLDGEIHGMLRAVAAEYALNQRRLAALRKTPEYRAAFELERPLVTIVLCTVEARIEQLIERAIPSALSQTYEPIELVVVSDAAGPETRGAVQALHDPRIRLFETTHRVEHNDPLTQGFVGHQHSSNYGHAQARGQWILGLDDDDALRPDAAEALLAKARATGAEVAYGLMEQHHPDGSVAYLGAFPPRPRDPEWKAHGLAFEPWDGNAGAAALTLTGLTGIFAREWVASVLQIPGDCFLLERMLRAGVRFAMVDQIVYDYYPSSLWDPADRSGAQH
jgi:hypothetical protein